MSSSTGHFDSVTSAPPDAIFALTAAFKGDTHPQKVNVGIGAYRTDNAKPWVLPVVKKAQYTLLNDPSVDHEYLPIAGLKSFTDASARLILGSQSSVLKEQRYCAIQAISGTGALRLGAEFLKKIKPNAKVLISNPTWMNHKAIFNEAGFPSIEEYPYYKASTRGFDFEGMMQCLNKEPNGSIVLLHVCAHNPTGVDPTLDQWKQIAEVMESKQHFPFFDCAYQGFASGNVDQDAMSVRYFVDEKKMEVFVAQSFSKNFGLYSERTGCLTCVAKTPTMAANVKSQIEKVQRPMISNPPAFGARVVSIVLNDAQLNQEWLDNLKTMSGRIIEVRQRLFDALQNLKTPGTWNHIIDQIGMFSYTGLTAVQSETLVSKFHIYLPNSGRISMAGLNSQNVQYFAESLDWVVRNVQ